VARLPQLMNIESYRACESDLKADAAARGYWVRSFCEHLELLTAAIAAEYPRTAAERLDAFRADYLRTMAAVEAQPERLARIDILYLDELRSRLLRQYGFDDPYRGVKARENELALGLLPQLLDELDATPDDTLVDKLAFGLMAGNLFDVGARAAAERFNGAAEFRQLRAAQPARPWFIDELDVWKARLAGGRRYRHVAFFVDNAGADICLGCLPLARRLLQQGARVTLLANSAPALNDVTASELEPLLHRAARVDRFIGRAWRGGQLSVSASGGQAPLIDLTQLAEPACRAVADADLIILHGMGRAVESNFRAAFACDCVRTAVLKDPAVAALVGARMFDCIFRFDAAG